MPLNIIVVALFFGSFAVAANVLAFVMIGKINERVSEAERISYFRWGTEVQKKYKGLYPTSKIPLLVSICVAMMLVGAAFLIRFWVFGNHPTAK